MKSSIKTAAPVLFFSLLLLSSRRCTVPPAMKSPFYQCRSLAFQEHIFSCSIYWNFVPFKRHAYRREIRNCPLVCSICARDLFSLEKPWKTSHFPLYAISNTTHQQAPREIIEPNTPNIFSFYVCIFSASRCSSAYHLGVYSCTHSREMCIKQARTPESITPSVKFRLSLMRDVS